MLKTAPIFTDHMVIQREKPFRIWGTGEDGTEVSAQIGSLKGVSEVVNGKWEIVLPAMPAGGAYTLKVTDGTETLTFSDIVSGEVWLCGGQSNMELVMINSDNPEPALNTCRESNVRLYHVGKRGVFDEQFFEEEQNSCWQLPERDTCQYWTAIGYYFGERLAKKLGVTVGLIECNYGGSSASAWISEKMLRSTEVGQSYLDDYSKGMEGLTDEEACQAYQEYCDYHNRWQERVAQCYNENPDISWDEVLEKCGENRYPGPYAPNNPLRPHGLYDTMITRITPYTMRGVLYYQGESDEHRPEGYEMLLSSLIHQWRTDFKDETLPFLLVQLPMFSYEDRQKGTEWALIREVQEKVYQNVRHTGLAVIPDCGEYNEIHPKEKRIPAKRLYLQALKEVYHLQENGTTAPMFRDAVAGNGTIHIHFDNVENGLELHGTSGFEVCGTDGEWYPAHPKVNRHTLILSSEKVPHPVGARYLWYNYGEVTLFERNGLPASPFRTVSD